MNASFTIIISYRRQCCNFLHLISEVSLKSRCFCLKFSEIYMEMNDNQPFNNGLYLELHYSSWQNMNFMEKGARGGLKKPAFTRLHCNVMKPKHTTFSCFDLHRKNCFEVDSCGQILIGVAFLLESNWTVASTEFHSCIACFWKLLCGISSHLCYLLSRDTQSVAHFTRLIA